MPSAHHGDSGFKRQIVVRVGPDDWPLLQHAAAEHGSYQAALIAGLRALATPASPAGSTSNPLKAKVEPKAPRNLGPGRTDAHPASVPPPPPIHLDEEIRAREAAKLLGLATSTVAGYIRSGRMPGRHDQAPTWLGWVTTRRAVETYRTRLLKPVAAPGN